MAFRKDLTTSANAAIMTSGTIVAGLVAAGVVKTADAAGKAAVSITEALIEVARPIVDADNEGFEAAEQAAPKSSGSKSTGSRSKSGGARSAAKSSGSGPDLKLGFGVFKGCTLAEVAELDADEAESTYGYTQGSGIDYLTWLADNANEAKVAKAAQAVVDAA
jgi:hypothetical protein